MKKISIVLLCFFLSLSCKSQGVHFSNDLDWAQALKQAKNEKKLIFVDCFATWCSPCKEMDKTIFSSDVIGNYMNKYFINLKLQFDTTKHDDHESRRWRDKVKEMQVNYNVTAFPTLLFIDSLGNLLSKEVGAILSETEFINKIKTVTDPLQRYDVIKEKYIKGDSSKSVVLLLLPEAIKREDWSMAYSIHNRFVDFTKDSLDRANIIMIYSSIRNSDSKGFKLLLSDVERFNEILKDAGKIQTVLKSHVIREVEDLKLTSERQPNWEKIKGYIQSKTPILVSQILLDIKINNASNLKDWEKYGALKMDYYDQFALSFDHNSRWWMNNDLMQIFFLVNDPRTLQRAAFWSKPTIYLDPESENADAMDTYANLLYKAGNRTEAIKWEEKALSIKKRDSMADVSDFILNLSRMKKNIPTWINHPEAAKIN